MTILFVTEFFPEEENLKFSGGVEAYNFFLVRELAKKHVVKVIYRSTSKSAKKHFLEAENPNFKAIGIFSGTRVDASFSSIPERIIFFLKVILKGVMEEFDIVQGNNFVTFVPAFIIGMVKNKPKVAWYADVFVSKWIELFGIGSGLFGEITERLSISLGWSHVIALSKSTKEKLVRQGMNSQKISTIYAGVDVNFFEEISAPKHKKFTICTISRLVSYKRVDLLIQAVSNLSNMGYDLNLKIIGKGPEKNNLIKLASDLKVGSKIMWLADLKRLDLGRELKSSNLFCLCSNEEGFGMVVIEAASCNLPYVISNNSTLLEITRSAQGGLVFSKNDPEDLTVKIKEIIDYPARYKVLSEKAGRLAKHYSWKSVAESFTRVYEACTEK